MEFAIDLRGPLPEEARLKWLLESEDPAAVGELDGEEGVWRVNSALSSSDLVALLARVGCPTPLSQVRLMPSTCCGGCSG